MESWKDGRITSIISPSGKYDPVVKMTANVLGVHSVGTICCTAAVWRHEVLSRNATVTWGRNLNAISLCKQITSKMMMKACPQLPCRVRPSIKI